MRDRLIELIKEYICSLCIGDGAAYFLSGGVPDLADNLLANGVMLVDTENVDLVTNQEPIRTALGMPLDELADLIRAKQEGRIILPPVKVGQICYKVWEGKILGVRVVSINYEPLPAFSYTIRFNSLGILCLMQDGTRNEKYSWDIYLTRREAEAKLKGGVQE